MEKAERRSHTQQHRNKREREKKGGKTREKKKEGALGRLLLIRASERERERETRNARESFRGPGEFQQCRRSCSSSAPTHTQRVPFRHLSQQDVRYFNNKPPKKRRETANKIRNIQYISGGLSPS